MTEEENRIDAARLRRNAYHREWNRRNADKRKLYRRPRSKEAKAKNAAYTREWSKRNIERVAARKKLYYIKNKERHLAKCKERRNLKRVELLAYHREYRKRNPEKVNEYFRNYYAKNKERMLARSKERRRLDPAIALRRLESSRRYYAANSDKHQALISKRRAMVRGASDGTFTAKQWKEMKAAYDNRCVYCLNVFERLTQDHVIPVSKGGAHAASNIVPACKSCNCKKNVAPWTPQLRIEIAA